MVGKSEPGKRGFQTKPAEEKRSPKQFYLEQPLDDWLTEESKRKGISRSELLNRILNDLIGRN